MDGTSRTGTAACSYLGHSDSAMLVRFAVFEAKQPHAPGKLPLAMRENPWARPAEVSAPNPRTPGQGQLRPLPQLWLCIDRIAEVKILAPRGNLTADQVDDDF